MSSLSGNNKMKLWTCCECKYAGISMNFGDCPQCNHARCFDCDVRSHATSRSEAEKEDRKVERSASIRGNRAQGEERECSNLEGLGRASGQIVQLYGSSTPPDTSGIPTAASEFVPYAQATHEATGASRLLIPIASGPENQPIFVLRENSDAELISYWHRILPELSRCVSTIGPLRVRVTSIHLFRVGLQEASSWPTIIVNTTQELSLGEKKHLQDILSASIRLTSNSISDLQLVFRQSRLRRTVYAHPSELPPICHPRNRYFSQMPGTGASIGIAGSFDDTATLGCYLLLDNVPMVLTVNHLIPLSSRSPIITHISEQDRFEMLLPVRIEEIRNLLARTDHVCDLCTILRRPELETSDEYICQFAYNVLRTVSGLQRCPFYQALKANCQADERCRVHPIARRYEQSGPRYRLNSVDRNKREMDWALFEVMHDSSFGRKQQLLSRHHDGGLSRRPGELYDYYDVKPGALIKSLGRTSGHQRGLISTTKSAVFLDNYVTQEWSVIKRPETPLDEWIEGGIGVEGDSGALIVDEDDDAVYGMLWARTGDGSATITLFTPMAEILSDIRERAGATRVEFMRKQEMPRPVRMTEEPEVIQSVPITMPLEDRTANTPLEEVVSSVGVRRQSSADTGHPRPFERYRHDVTELGIPRSEVSAESSAWPGRHTYLRQAIAPEQE